MMANKTTSDLPEATDMAQDDLLYAVIGGNSRGIQKQNLYPSALFEDQKAASTNGGASTSGSWLTRTLNTEVYDDIGLTLGSDQISLAAGDYQADAWAAFYRSDACRIRVRDVTNSVTLVVGDNSYANNTNLGSVMAELHGRFTLADTATIELQYRVTVGTGTNGLGVQTNWGEVEIYAGLGLTRLS